METLNTGDFYAVQLKWSVSEVGNDFAVEVIAFEGDVDNLWGGGVSELVF